MPREANIQNIAQMYVATNIFTATGFEWDADTNMEECSYQMQQKQRVTQIGQKCYNYEKVLN